MLLVDHREPERLVGDLLLEDRVGPDEHVDRAVGEAHQHALPRTPFLAAGEDGDADADAVEQAEQGRVMLAGKDFGRREQCCLGPAFDRQQHRHHRDDGLARSDVALKQAEHRHALRHVPAKLLDHAALRVGESIRNAEFGAQAAVARQRRGALRARRLPQQHQRQLVGENLVIGEAAAGILDARLAMRLGQRRAPPPPALARGKARLDPLRQFGRALDRHGDKLAHALVGDALGQRIDRLAQRQLGFGARRQNLGMDDLPFLAIGFELAGDGFRHAHRQLFLRPAGIVEVDQADRVARAVRGKHPQRPPARARFAQLERRQLENDIVPEQRRARRGRAHPLDRPGRQMIKQVNGAGQAELREQFPDLRPDALQRLDLGEQRIEDFGAHGPSW